jgi:hypothetical protein
MNQMFTVDDLARIQTPPRPPGSDSTFGTALIANYPDPFLRTIVRENDRVEAIVGEPVTFEFAHPAIFARRFTLVRAPDASAHGPRIVPGTLEGTRFMARLEGAFTVTITIDGGFSRSIEILAHPASVLGWMCTNDARVQRMRLRGLTRDASISEKSLGAFFSEPISDPAQLAKLVGRKILNVRDYGN